MIDLHSHTDHSDGSCSPVDLVRLASSAGLRALAITDHDTLSGYDEALRSDLPRSLELIQGIEITCKWNQDNVHLLGYFLSADAGAAFREWLVESHGHRRERNIRLVKRLNELGVDIVLSEVEALGRTMTGRPHFARVLIAKGYARNMADAFSKYLGEHAAGFVERQGPGMAEAIERIRAAGGISSLAHPVRIDFENEAEEKAFLGDMKDAGLEAIEAFHTDHSPADTERFLGFARHFGFAVTGGSDFHGTNKSETRLGVPAVSMEWLARLRALA